MNYRNIARHAIENATIEIESGNKQRLRYAALELRMALEALIYEKAGLYKEELSNKKLSTWQPKKLLTLLLEIDPVADKSSSIAVGIEEEYGKPASKMTSLGKDRVIGLKEIKKYYDKLGSYLHTQTIDQLADGKGPKPDGMRTRCNEIKEIINEVLASPVFNADFKVTSSIECGECGTKIVRRIPTGSKSLEAKCINCPASYTLTVVDENKTSWQPNIHKVKCANELCMSPFELWKSEIEIGIGWKCKECQGENRIVPCIQYKSADEIDKKG